MMPTPQVIEATPDEDVAPEVTNSDRTRSTRLSDESDVALGARIRAARLAANMSLEVHGQTVGVSYQQIQKYEIGKTRMAVSMLRKIAAALDVHSGAFFDDIKPLPRDVPSRRKMALHTANLLHQIRDPRVSKQLHALIEVLLNEESARADMSKDTTRDTQHEPIP